MPQSTQKRTKSPCVTSSISLFLDLLCLLLSPSLLCHPSSPQPLVFKPAPLNFHSKKLGNCILIFCCPLREYDTSLLKALELTARSLSTFPSYDPLTHGSLGVIVEPSEVMVVVEIDQV